MNKKEEREEAIQKAKEEFGEDIVKEVLENIYTFGLDSTRSMFIDLEKYEHVAVIEMIYFG